MMNGELTGYTARSAAICILAMVVCGVAIGQTKRPGSEFDIFGDLDRVTPTVPPTTVQPRAIALESTIDPEKYFVGPSDVFSVNVWISPPVGVILTVTPEGTLIIPAVGEVKVADMKLADAKKKAVAEIKKKYLAGDATVTLVVPRQVVVTVTGNVLNPGSYILASYNRVDKAIEEANKLQRAQDPREIESLLSTMSTRNIRVTHKDGSVSRADIRKFLATKDDRLNPYLREGDIIVVPRNDFRKSVIGVYGEVNAPDRYEYVQGDSVKDALRIAYGFTPLAISDSIELMRLDIQGATISSRILNGTGIMKGTELDIALEPGDRIVVRARPDFRADYRVEVKGEVVYPGTYPITRNNTRLSEIIKKAGGFTEFASLNAAELARRPVKISEVEFERLKSIRGAVSPEDSAYFYLETNLRIQGEPVSVDFEKLFKGNDASQDIVVKDGDEIVVPSLKSTVYVFGQVASPGHVPFAGKADVDYYVRKAGGFTDRARSSDMKIVKARTRQWLSPGDTDIEEGDFIWVPKERERPFAYYLNIVGGVASIISVAASLIILTTQAR